MVTALDDKYLAVKGWMVLYPVKILQPDSKDHARHALEQALVDKLMTRSEYDVLLGYVLQVMFKAPGG